MRQFTLLALFLIPFACVAAVPTVEYAGQITNIHMSKSNEVKIGVRLPEEEILDCHGDDWPFYFNLGEAYSSSWLDLLLLANRTQDTIRIGYTPNSNSTCSIQYVAIMEQDGVLGGDEEDPITGDPTLTRTGKYGNVALLGTNGLTAVSYEASHSYRQDGPEAAFDGFIYNESFNNHAEEMINRGLWLLSKTKENKGQEYWLQVEFNKQVEITSFRIAINEQARRLGRLPKGVTIQISDDGINFFDHDALRLNNSRDQRALLTSKASLKFFRMRIDSNYGDTNYIEIDELELFAD